MNSPFNSPIEIYEIDGLWDVRDSATKHALTLANEDKKKAEFIAHALNKHDTMGDLIDAISRIACGEDQVADDDSEGMGVIYTMIEKFKDTP